MLDTFIPSMIRVAQTKSLNSRTIPNPFSSSDDEKQNIPNSRRNEFLNHSDFSVEVVDYCTVFKESQSTSYVSAEILAELLRGYTRTLR